MADSAKGEWRVLVLLLIGLIAAEAILRVTQDGLSGDVAHMNVADSIIEAVDEAPGLRILMIGNSLLFRGIDPADLEARLEASLGEDVSIGMVHPDGSGPLQWSYLYRRTVFRPGRLPDVMIMAFGPGHLRDRSAESELLRLAAHHVDRRDIGLLFEEDLTGIEGRSQFLAARMSTAFALRDRISPRIFDALIPDYRELAPLLLQAPAARNDEVAPAAEGAGPTFRHLDRLLDDAAEAGVPLVAIPMPAPGGYTVDGGATASFAVHDIQVLPTSGEDVGIDPVRFYDGQHLDPQGRTYFTGYVAPMIAEALRAVPPGNSP